MARDGEIYKDKIEVSLDARQIFYLFFGGSVVVGLVFVLGVMVGRRVEARGFSERAHLEATLDPLAALDRLEGSGALSFPAALRGEAVSTPVDKMIGAQAAVPPSVVVKQSDPPVAKPAPKPEAKEAKPEAKEAKPEAKEAKPEAKEAKVDAKDAKPEAKNAKPEAKDAKPEAKDTKGDAKEAKVEARDAKPEAKPADDKPERRSRYTLQLSSFQDRSEAEAFAQSVKTSGFSPYIIEGEVDNKQFYRVRIGSYRSLDAANDAKAEFEKASKKSAIVTKL